ncbi:MAG: hypothetical protein MZV64_74265 [Ignavibacteriales bacterium]|nr:hypothetical protein [Ignavibacteriales bacterium]
MNVEGTMLPARSSRSSSRAGTETSVTVPLPEFHRRVRPPDRRGQDGGRQGEGGISGTLPITMYGCNKLYCEHLGRYYAAALQAARGRAARRQGRLPVDPLPGAHLARSRCRRGGTCDYAPEMMHAAAQGHAVRLLRPARTSGSRSWRCRTPSTRSLSSQAAPPRSA